MVLVPAVVEGEQAVSGPLRVPLTPGQRARLSGSEVTLGLRPSVLTLSDAGEVPATVDLVEHLGSHPSSTARRSCVGDRRPSSFGATSGSTKRPVGL